MEEPDIPFETAPDQAIRRKEMFIEEIKAGQGTHKDYFQLVEYRQADTKQGDPYLALTLADRTGRVDARIWDLSIAPQGLQAGQYVRVEYEPGLYKEKLQLRIYRIRILDAKEIAVEDYLPVSKRDRDEMMEELIGWIGKISDSELRIALLEIYEPQYGQLRDAPAAMSKHQAWIGGLVEHVLKLLGLAEAVCGLYPALNRDVLYAGCIVHDIGKIRELEYKTSIGYTREGSLAGHIVIGCALWREHSKSVSPALRDHVEHLIVSHHGKGEWGAPKPPMTVEAQIFHFLDMIDSQYEILTNLIAAGVDEKGMTGWQDGVKYWNGK